MTHWKRWFAWYPVKLHIGGWAFGCVVEYQQTREGFPTGAFGSGPETVTRYRLPDDAPEFHTHPKGLPCVLAFLASVVIFFSVMAELFAP